MTWPLAIELARSLPSDLGDPVFNCWVLARNGRWLIDFLAGKPVSDFWDGRIFYPAPLTLAYSEHLVVPSALALPLVAATGNVVLSYNVLLLSSFFLSAFGVFLLVRDLTGHTAAAFLAGLFYGFSPYRVDQLPHLQVLSSQWLPFALLGLRRFVASGRPLPLALSALALVAQGLSCGYYVLYFLPAAGIYAAFELLRQGRDRDPRRILGLALAAAAVSAVTLPFLLPYREINRLGLLVRHRSEVELYSADILSSLTAPENLRLWGGVLNAYRRAEGALFLGFVPVALAAAAVVAGARRVRRTLARSPRPVSVLRSAVLSETVFLLAAAVTTWILALGPVIRFHGRAILGPGPYALLYDHVPGFDGLRVPSRLTMLLALLLAILAGKGAAALLGRDRRGVLLAAGLALLFLVEATAVPIGVLRVAETPALRPLVGREAPAIYRHVAQLPPEAILVELPVASATEELWSMIPALQHGHRIVNGYSGLFPASYVPLRPGFVLQEPERAWAAVAAAGATHVIVHQGVWPVERKGERVIAWLEARGARALATEDRDVLLALPRKPAPQ